MNRTNLSDLAAFATIARHKSFRRAAAELAVSPSALSHTLRALETRLGVRLLNRTTRAVAVTEAGDKLLARLVPALEAIECSVNQAVAGARDVAGILRLNAPRDVSVMILLPLIKLFMHRHPSVEVELVSDDALSDIVAGGFDAGVRFDEKLPKDMIACPLSGSMRLVISASPDYFVTRACPHTPDELKDHICIRQRFASGELAVWPLERDGQTQNFTPQGPLTLNSQELVLDACLEGLGLACLFEPLATPYIASGRLISVLSDWQSPFPGPSLYYPSRRQMPPPLRAFVEMVREGNSKSKT